MTSGLSRRDQCEIAAALTEHVWQDRRAKVIDFLMSDYRGKTGGKFSRVGAEKAFNSFVETMVFVARETGEPQLGGKP